MYSRERRIILRKYIVRKQFFIPTLYAEALFKEWVWRRCFPVSRLKSSSFDKYNNETIILPSIHLHSTNTKKNTK